MINFKDFFQDLRKLKNDQLGIISFLLQPIQRIPRYQLLLREMIKEIIPYGAEQYQLLAQICEAEKRIVRLLRTINEAISVFDLKCCYKVRKFPSEQRRHR